MIVTRINKKGEKVKYTYSYVGPNKVPISTYIGKKVAQRRQTQRFNREKPKVLASEVPNEIVLEMQELRLLGDVTFVSIAKMYGLTPYIVKKCLNNLSGFEPSNKNAANF